MATTDSVRATAWKHHREGNGAGAEQLYRHLLDQQPDQSDAANLGALLREQGRLQEALQHYQGWLEHFPAAPELSLNAVNCAIATGALDQARAWLAPALTENPEHKPLIQAQARLYQAAQRWDLAMPLLDGLCKKHGNDASVWLDLGLAQHRQGQRLEALDSFERAGNLAPADQRAAANRLTVLGELGRWDEANSLIDGLGESIRSGLQVRGAIAHLLMGQQRMVEAADGFQQLCELEPQEPLHWLNYTACLRSLKHNMAALAVAKRGCILHPQHSDLTHTLGQILADVGKQKQAMALLWKEGETQTDALTPQQLFNLQFLGAGYRLIDGKTLAGLANRWEEQQLLMGVGPLWADRIRRPLTGRPLRVGYLSADFCNHPVGRFLLPVLQAHDPGVVEVAGLNCGPHSDALQEQLRSHCQHWLDLRFCSDLEAARMVSDLELDVLVELGGFTAGSRLAILCHRPAPLQLSYLGYFAPTYLSCIDGWIGDTALFGGLDSQDQKAQRLLMTEGGYMTYRDSALPDPQGCSPGRGFRFGSFNHARKLSERAIGLFCAVMAAVPEAELVLKSISFVEEAEQERVRQLFAAQDLPCARLRLLPWVEGRDNHLACYHEIDVALDPLPYGGATTTCEALAMGVPVVSLAGAGMVGRLSASVLKHSNCGDWIASTDNDYITIAQKLAAAGPRNREQRLALRERVLNSPLADNQRLTRELERLYREAAAIAVNASSR
jgi:protein O-GlcNAc transferase